MIAEASDDATVTGVLRWEFSPPAGREAQLSRLLPETNAPVPRRLADPAVIAAETALRKLFVRVRS